MNIESVKPLFRLFSGEDDIERFMPLITLAAAETARMLADGADSSDIRLDFLGAAIANYRFQQINAAHDRTVSTYAGKLAAAPGNGSSLRYAEKLLGDYISLCGDLIKPRTFMFMSFGAETEELKNA